MVLLLALLLKVWAGFIYILLSFIERGLLFCCGRGEQTQEKKKLGRDRYAPSQDVNALF